MIKTWSANSGMADFTCPHCGEELEFAFSHDKESLYIQEAECGSCDKIFTIEAVVTTTYVTTK